MLVVAFSGGKDSTAMALRLAEVGTEFQLLNTATGNELPEVREHIEKISIMADAPLVDVGAPTLAELIAEQQCLPNWRMRWCTRMIKIEPCAEWLRAHPDVVLAVGLRADEPGRAGGTYEGSEIIYPLREWGWDEARVIRYVESRGVTVPRRTDCAVCFFQTLAEWKQLLDDHPEEYARGEQWEAEVGHTFRSDSRDTWPAALKELRREFERGRVPRPRKRKVGCRVCDM